MADEPKDSVIWHQSGINLKGEPFVQLLKNTDIIGQMSPEQAREHAQATLEAAEASEQDAFLWDFTRNKMELEEGQAFMILQEFRKYREERTGKSSGPTRPTDWVFPKDQENKQG